MTAEPLIDLLERLARADLTLLQMMNDPGALADHDRLQGKREGVRLAASYVDEAIRQEGQA